MKIWDNIPPHVYPDTVCPSVPAHQKAMVRSGQSRSHQEFPTVCLSDNLRCPLSHLLCYFGLLMEDVENWTQLRVLHQQLIHLLPPFLSADELEFAGIYADCGCWDCRNQMVNPPQHILYQIGRSWEVLDWTADQLQFAQALPLAATKLLLAQDMLQWWVVHVYWCMLIAKVCFPGDWIVVDCQQLAVLHCVACLGVM